MAVSLSDGDLDDDLDETHDINVTPFIDVILVLLIIFMVAAPLSTVDLPIDLPSSSATPQKKPDKPTYVSIKPDLSLAIGETPVKRAELLRELSRVMPDEGKERTVFLRGDRAAPYGEVMDVLELLRSGGYKFKLVALERGPGASGEAPAAQPSQP
jgi:biopolymer transport protein ExbD